ncbi:hypothetical protein E5Z46_06895 [Geobacillus kaustophilus NBRC 102445]|nr:hypothetical protein E5Z46_06895 [Geobacillus kaustophilus NBRC 102445]TLS34605.1 hypothetical protein FDK15_01490 [Geobacillus thermoleovorans]
MLEIDHTNNLVICTKEGAPYAAKRDAGHRAPPEFAWHLFTWIISITFMMIVQFLVTVFDNPGRFLAILLLIAQLVGSAGTYPIELVPGALQSLHPWLPMTHAIRGLRAVISSGDFLVMWKEAAILLATAAVFALATLVYFLLRYRRRYAVWTETAAQT